MDRNAILIGRSCGHVTVRNGKSVSVAASIEQGLEDFRAELADLPPHWVAVTAVAHHADDSSKVTCVGDLRLEQYLEAFGLHARKTPGDDRAASAGERTD